jgi:hypothetical protein
MEMSFPRLRAIRLLVLIGADTERVGFLLALWLVKSSLTSTIADNYGAELRIEKVAVNPFVMRKCRCWFHWRMRITWQESSTAGNRCACVSPHLR